MEECAKALLAQGKSPSCRRINPFRLDFRNQQFSSYHIISCLNSCEGNSGTSPFPSSSAFKEPFPTKGGPCPSVIGGIAFAPLPWLLLARMIPNPTREETATTTPITMPAMAPEDRCEDDLEAVGLLDGLDSGEDDPEALGLLDVVASAPD